MVWIGAAVGAGIIIVDEMLKARGGRYRAPVLAAAVGIYLPLELAIPSSSAEQLAYVVERKKNVGADPDATRRLHRPGVLFAAGLITGEALMGILIAIPIVSSGRADVLALPEWLQARGLERVARTRVSRGHGLARVPGGDCAEAFVGRR